MLWNLVSPGLPPINMSKDRDDLTFAQFGIDAGADDNATALQAAFDEAAASGRWLVGSAGAFNYGSEIQVPSGLKLRRAPHGVTRLQKNFTSSGTAGITSKDLLTTGSHDIIFYGVELGAVAHELVGVQTGKVLLLRGNNITLERVRLKTWSGWGINTLGNNHIYRDCIAEDPYSGLGADGFHYSGGSGCLIEGMTGTAGDDFIAIASPLTGLSADLDISDVVIRNCNGASLHARGLFVGIAHDTHTSTVEDVSASDSEFTGAAVTGAVYLASISAGGFVRNIALDTVAIDGGTALAGISIRGGGVFENLSLNDCDIGAGTNHVVQTIGSFDGLSITGGSIDGSGGTKAAFAVVSPGGAVGLVVNVPSVVCGAEDGFLLSTGAQLLDAPDITATVTEVPNGFAALRMNTVEDRRFTIHATKAAGATTSIGIKEGGASERNLFENGTLTGVDTPVSTPSATSTYTNNAGYP